MSNLIEDPVISPKPELMALTVPAVLKFRSKLNLTVTFISSQISVKGLTKVLTLPYLNRWEDSRKSRQIADISHYKYYLSSESPFENQVIFL